jgi:hypothetical protein
MTRPQTRCGCGELAPCSKPHAAVEVSWRATLAGVGFVLLVAGLAVFS